MSGFTAFEKMPESLQKLGLDLVTTKRLDAATWVVTEKIHGANFSFVLQGDTLKYAKRKDLLRWTDDFFGFQLVAERLDAGIMRLFEHIRKDHAFQIATVYGELYGGHYPHGDVPAEARVQAIQTGIHYSPTIEFCVFDIAVEADESRKYLDYADVMRYCAACEVPFARPLLIGTLNQALFFDTRFDSKVPAILGLPAIVPNLVEGIVVKPLHNIVVQTAKGELRPIFKIKNKEFAEEQFHEAQAWSYQHAGASASERLLYIVPELRRYVTQQRLQSTFSKIGSLLGATQERRNAIHAALIDDAMQSFWEANPELLGEFEAADLGWLLARLAAAADECIDAYLKSLA